MLCSAWKIDLKNQCTLPLLFTKCIVSNEKSTNKKPINKFYSLIMVMKSMLMKIEEIAGEQIISKKVNAIISTDISCRRCVTMNEVK